MPRDAKQPKKKRAASKTKQQKPAMRGTVSQYINYALMSAEEPTTTQTQATEVNVDKSEVQSMKDKTIPELRQMKETIDQLKRESKEKDDSAQKIQELQRDCEEQKKQLEDKYESEIQSTKDKIKELRAFLGPNNDSIEMLKKKLNGTIEEKQTVIEEFVKLQGVLDNLAGNGDSQQSTSPPGFFQRMLSLFADNTNAVKNDNVVVQSNAASTVKVTWGRVETNVFEEQKLEELTPLKSPETCQKYDDLIGELWKDDEDLKTFFQGGSGIKKPTFSKTVEEKTFEKSLLFILYNSGNTLVKYIAITPRETVDKFDEILYYTNSTECYDVKELLESSNSTFLSGAIEHINQSINETN